MKFEFSEDQEALRAEARRFLDSNATLEVVDATLKGDVGYDTDLWSQICQLGWGGVAVSEAHGGVGASYLELCVLAEEVGRSLAPVPWSSTVYLATDGISVSGSEVQKESWLPKLVAGEVRGTFAWADQAASQVIAQIDAGGFQLTGAKEAVLDAAIAGVAIVVALHDGVKRLFLVNLMQSSVSVEKTPGIDDSRPVSTLILDGAKAELLGTGATGDVDGLLDRAAVLFAFEQIGGAQAVLDMAVAHAKDRFAFGRPIGSFQAIKHMLADLYSELELARSNCYYAAWALWSGSPQLAEAAACARLSASQSFFNCARHGIQAHGGMGFTWELGAHFFYRRATQNNLVLGGQAYWRERLVSILQAKTQAGSPVSTLAAQELEPVS